jgi:hypothetical protein
MLAMYGMIMLVKDKVEIATPLLTRDILFVLAIITQYLFFMPLIVCSNANYLIGIENKSEFIKYHNLKDFINTGAYAVKNLIIFIVSFLSANLFNIFLVIAIQYATSTHYIKHPISADDFILFFKLSNLSLLALIPLIMIHTLLAFKFKYLNTIAFVMFTVLSVSLVKDYLKAYLYSPYSIFMEVNGYAAHNALDLTNSLKVIGASMGFALIIIGCIALYKKRARNKDIFFKA